MEAILGAGLAIGGAWLAYEIARRKGRNGLLWGLGGLAFGIIFVPAVTLVRSLTERRVYSAGVVISLVIYLVAISGSIMYSLVSSEVSYNVSSHSQTIDSILSGDDRTEGLSSRYVHLPVSVSVPVFGPATYNGYFTIQKDGGGLGETCMNQTFDYSGRVVEDSYVLSIDWPTIERLAECN